MREGSRLVLSSMYCSVASGSWSLGVPKSSTVRLVFLTSSLVIVTLVYIAIFQAVLFAAALVAMSFFAPPTNER